jgi:serine/threonine protein kinase/tetratricopeptide (TPR) repeat protein
MLGSKLGPYEIREEIGRGGMATVYRAYQPTVDRDVAIKVITKAIAHDDSVIQRFQREARLIARLEHPHILPVYDFDGGHDPPYIVMRYLDTGTLKEVLRQGALPPEVTSYLMRQVCAALDYAHRQGIVHCDIKPSNIMIDGEGNAFVTDFGLAQLVAGSSGDKLFTATGAIMGTPEYIAPEQAQGKEIDQRADIYALGVLLFELLTGQLPYVADHPMATIIMHTQEPIPKVTTSQPNLPAAVDEVITRMMAKAPQDRYTSAAAIAEAITVALAGKVTSSPSRRQIATGDSPVLQQKHITAEAKPGSSGSTPTRSEQQKQVTVLYANLAEFMEIAKEEVEDPLKMRRSLWKQFDEVVTEFGGSIDAYTGNTVLALWGVESSSEDDAERAVKAALAMQQVVKKHTLLLRDWKDEQPVPLQIGIHTGITLLTHNKASNTYRATGSTVTMTIRLEQAAPTGGILISSETYNYVRGVFLVEGLEPIRFHGRKQAVQIYLVKGSKPRAFRKSVPAVEGIKTRTIGREAELKQLIETLELATEDEETQVITIVAEAGVGKSRLIYELSEWEEKLEGDFWYFPVNARPQMINQPFALFRELFDFRFEIQDSDHLDTVQEKFELGIARFLGPDTAEQAHVIGHLLGFTFPDSPYLRNRDPQQLNSLAQKHLTDFFVTVVSSTMMTAGNPTLGAWLQFDNIHWADDRSLNFINHLVENQPDLPLVVTCTARPSLYDRRPTWGSGQDFHQRLELRPLSRRDSRNLVEEILQKADHIPKELRDLIVNRAEGNPFYMEELVKILVEDRVILKGLEAWSIELDRLAQVPIPGTLTGLLQARLDSLLLEERFTLQRAAVIGRVFWDGAVKALQSADNIPVDVDHALGVLARRELIFIREETAFTGMREYIFKSTMLREATYGGITKRQQRAYHAEVARWLVDIAGARAGEDNLLIAEHYEIAGKNVRAADYLHRAGRQAMAVDAYAEANSFYEHGLNLLTGQLGLNARRLQAALHYQLGAVDIEQGYYTAGDKHLEASLNIAREVGDGKKSCIEALVFLGKSKSKQGNFDAAKTFLQEALTLAREAGDKANMAFALRWLGGTARFQQEFDQAEAYLMEALALARETDEQASAAYTLNGLGENARYQGKYAEASAYYQEALSIIRALDDQSGIAPVTLNLGHIAAASGEIKIALEHYLEALRVNREIQMISVTLETLAGLAGLKVSSGEFDRAIELLGLALNHPACSEDTRLFAEPVLAQLGAKLLPGVIETGLKRGRSLDLDSVVQELLAET